MSAQPKLMSDIEGLAHQVDPLSRRGFFLAASAATAAGYTLAAGPVRADAIHTDSAGLTASEAKVKVSDGEMPVYFARPANAPNPPVILVAMEIFGVHEYIKDVTRRLGKLGAFAIAPDYYFRKGVDLTKITDIPQLMPIVNAKPDAELLSDLDATVAWAKSQGGDTSRLGIMGFCRGGRTVWEYAGHNKDVKAAVVHGGQRALQITAAIPATMAICYLLIVFYFVARGGYKAVHLDSSGREIEVAHDAKEEEAIEAGGPHEA